MGQFSRSIDINADPGLVNFVLIYTGSCATSDHLTYDFDSLDPWDESFTVHNLIESGPAPDGTTRITWTVSGEGPALSPQCRDAMAQLMDDQLGAMSSRVLAELASRGWLAGRPQGPWREVG